MVVTGHGLQHQRAVFCTLGHGAGLIQAGGKGNHAPAGNASVGGFEAGNVVQGRRLADGAAGVGASGAGGQTGTETGRRTAGGAAGDPFQVPGVLHRAVVAGFVGGAHGELVHIGLAQHDGTFGGHLFHHGGGVGGNKGIQHLRAAAGAHALGAEDILVGDGQAGEEGSIAGGNGLISGIGLGQGLLGGHGNETVEFTVVLLDAGQEMLGELPGGEVPGSQTGLEFCQCLVVHGVAHHLFTQSPGEPGNSRLRRRGRCPVPCRARWAR